MTQDSWVDADYKVPSSGSGYMNFEEGDNTVRILDKPTFGFELWMDGKPTRRKTNDFTAKELASADINKFNGKKKKPQHFWAVPVWNYEASAVQLLNITQQGVQNFLLSLLRNPKWGKLDTYDVIIKKDKNATPMYSVTPDPKSPLTKEMKGAWKAVTVDMEKYFEGGHPINSVDAGAFSEDEIDDIIEE